MFIFVSKLLNICKNCLNKFLVKIGFHESEFIEENGKILFVSVAKSLEVFENESNGDNADENAEA